MAFPKLAASTALEIELVLTMLASTPQHIARVARGHDDRQLHRQPAPEAWSARDIVAHLRACADVWGCSIDRMIKEDHPTIRYVSPRSWIKTTDYLEQGFRISLRAFSESRTALLDTLRSLNPAGWSRRATFTGTTVGRDATVLIYAKRIADHEVRHLDQLRRTLTRWGILDERPTSGCSRRRAVALREEAPVALAQADLAFPSGILESLGQPVDALLNVRGHCGGVLQRDLRGIAGTAAIAPIGLHFVAWPSED
jgi:hypothetical protein